MSSNSVKSGEKRAKLWTYVILAGLLVIGVMAANFWMVNPERATNGVQAIAGLPSWAFPTIGLLVGAGIFYLGLKIEADWPEGVGAFIVAASIAAMELMIGWEVFAIGGMVVIPIAIPIVVFLAMMGYSLLFSR